MRRILLWGALAGFGGALVALGATTLVVAWLDKPPPPLRPTLNLN